MPVLPTPDRLDSAEARRNRRCAHDLCRTGLGGATTYVAIPIPQRFALRATGHHPGSAAVCGARQVS
jgi:hypothetical protein